MSGPPASQALLPNLAPLGLRDLPQDAVDVVVEKMLEPLRESGVCKSRWMEICLLLRGTGACNDPNDPVWKAACEKLGLNRIVIYTGAPRTWRGTLRELCSELTREEFGVSISYFPLGRLLQDLSRGPTLREEALEKLFQRAAVGCPLIVAAFLNHGVDPNAICSMSVRRSFTGSQKVNMALIFATVYNVHPSVGAERRAAVIEVLLAANANPEVTEFPTGKTPLMFACQYGSVPTIKALLAGNADIEHGDMFDKTPLVIASTGDGGARVIQALFEHTPPPNTEAVWADRNPHSGLRGFRPLGLAVSARKSAVAKELLKHDPDVNFQGPGKMTALMVASRLGDIDVVEAILAVDATVDVDVQNERGRTALMLAARNCRSSSIGGGRHHVAIVKALLAYRVPVNVNLQDGAGETALMWAAIHGNRTMIRTLLDARADIRLTNVEGRAAKDFGPLLPEVKEELLGFQEL